jgi:D-psicose/D-tagatose/L-ribulose 3-epimerase
VKFGINTFLFESPFTDEGIRHFKAFKDIGFDGVEIGLENKGDIDYNKVLKGLQDNGLECCSIQGLHRCMRSP